MHWYSILALPPPSDVDMCPLKWTHPSWLTHLVGTSSHANVWDDPHGPFSEKCKAFYCVFVLTSIEKWRSFLFLVFMEHDLHLALAGDFSGITVMWCNLADCSLPALPKSQSRWECQFEQMFFLCLQYDLGRWHSFHSVCVLNLFVCVCIYVCL
jgi:hypothetical protein